MVKNLVFGIGIVIAFLLFGCIGQNNDGTTVTVKDSTGKENTGAGGNQPLLPAGGNTFTSNGRMNMYFIALEHEKDQPEAILIEKSGKTMLIDSGSKDTYPVLKKFLQNKGVETIDVLVSTRSNENYSGGLANIARDFKILKFIRPCGTSVENSAYETFSKSISASVPTELMGEKAEYCYGLDYVREAEFGSIQLMMVRGGTPDIEANVANTLKVTYGNVCVLLPTNSNAGAQRELVNYYSQHIKCRIIDAPGNGLSRSNVESRLFFTQLEKPQWVIITGSKEDGTRHGRDSILTTIKDLGMKYFETYQDGTVLVSTDGNSYTITAGN